MNGAQLQAYEGPFGVEAYKLVIGGGIICLTIASEGVTVKLASSADRLLLEPNTPSYKAIVKWAEAVVKAKEHSKW